MLHYVVRELHRYTIDRLFTSLPMAKLDLSDRLTVSTYETLFAVKRAPVANYLFTDLDRLSGYEIDAATNIAMAVRAADPRAMISNWPNRALGRYALLRLLHEAGLNSFNVWRLDEARAPGAYPVFIRREQDALGPETPLLQNEAEYRSAVVELQKSGKGLTGRIAVQYRQSADGQGIFRKYGAYCFRGRIVPQHLFMSPHWIVKRSALEKSDAMIAEEERYVFENPHADALRRIFELAQTDFGRIDYAIVDGRIEVFEINTNPNFPRMRAGSDGRHRRRIHVLEGLVAGFASLDPPRVGGGLVKFKSPKPKLHRLRARSLRRRLNDVISGLRWRFKARRP